MQQSAFLTSRFLHRIYRRGLKTMHAWQTLSFGDLDNLQLNPTSRIPVMENKMDVLVKVHAASINPLDVRMLHGYGSTAFHFLRKLSSCRINNNEFPLTLGRDFSGTVVNVGKGVKNLQIGDEVWGAVSPLQNGSHAEFVLGSIYNTTHKPSSLSHIEAASFPYAALTAWSALCYFGQLSEKSAFGKKILITGAAGGVGTFAVQLLKSWGADVAVTCSSHAVELLLNLGADTVLDYKNPDFKKNLKDLNGLDVIFDNVGGDYPDLTINLLKPWNNSKYITLISPLLKNADKQGLFLGTFMSSVQAGLDTVMSLKDGKSFRWAYFIPDSRALKSIAKMVDNQQIQPVIQESFNFINTPKAYERMQKGHARGKTVINMLNENCAEDEIEQQNV